MVPIRLHLKNFLSYRGSVLIDFSGLDLACLSGDNGAGKSALLDAMTWAIWGESRAQRDAELISLGESETEVTFEFRMGMREYRVMRRRTQARPTLEFDTRTPGTDNWLPIGGDSIRDTQARILQEIRLDYETFANSAFLRQGQADLFTQNKPGDRKRILSEILDLSGYDRLVVEARSELRARRTRLDDIQTRIGRIDLQLAERHEKEVELAELDEAVEAAESRISEVRGILDTLRNRLSSADMAESMLERTTLRIARLEQQTTDIKNQRAKSEAKLAELTGIISRETEIVEVVKDQRAWRQKAEAFASALATRQPLLARKQDIERAISEERANLDRRLALLRQSSTAAQQRIDQLGQKKAEAGKLEAQIANLRSRLERLPEANAQLEALRNEVTTLSGENASLHTRMNEIKERIEALKVGDATCPVCRRPLEDGDHTHIHEEWTTEGRSLGDAFRINKARIDKLNGQMTTIRQEVDELHQLGRSSAGLEARLNQINTELAGQAEAEKSLQVAEQEASDIEERLANQDFLTDERQELALIEQRLTELPYDEQAHKAAIQSSQDLERAEKAFQQLERAKSDLAGLRGQLDELETRLKSIAAEREEAEKDAAELRKSLEGIDDVRKQHALANKEHEELTTAVSAMERNRGSLRRQLDELDELEKEHTRLRDESRRLSAETDAYNELVTAFGRNGIQAMVIENILPELEEEANRILDRMTTKHLEVRFRTTREAVSSDNTIETLDIIIRDEHGTRPYQMFSGGEAFRINFAIRVALSKLLARRAGASIDTLIIDEGFGTQDQQGRDGLIEALQSVTSDFNLVLVITHVDELRYQFPNRIEVTKTDNGSRATLV